MASLPPSRCCTIGALHEGKPMGEVKNIANIPTYLSYPENKQTANAILILSDIIGYEFVNTRLYVSCCFSNPLFLDNGFNQQWDLTPGQDPRFTI